MFGVIVCGLSYVLARFLHLVFDKEGIASCRGVLGTTHTLSRVGGGPLVNLHGEVYHLSLLASHGILGEEAVSGDQSIVERLILPPFYPLFHLLVPL